MTPQLSPGANARGAATHYYNENDPSAAAWLRQLIADGVIPAGDVDTRSIVEVQPDDVRHYTQCHWFAGIGGWAEALRLAGWPVDRPVWTCSCPCQPWSGIGKGKGAQDEQHLWPAFFRFVPKRRPAIIFGEQVASPDALVWLDGVFADLENADYACGASDLPAAGVSAPHIRQRLYWVADAARIGRHEGEQHGEIYKRHEAGRDRTRNGGAACGLGDTIGAGLERHAGHEDNGCQSGRVNPEADGPASSAGGTSWSAYEVLRLSDGTARRIEPGTFPMAHGVPARMGRLRGYGNAIVPQVAAEFIKAAMSLEAA